MEELIRSVESFFLRRDLPEIRPGDTVRVYVKVKETRVNPKTKKPEEKVRLQAYEGVVIAERGRSSGKSIVVRKISSGIGVERIFPLISPSVERIEIVKRAKVRRAKLGYLRGRIGKHAKLKDRQLSAEEMSSLYPAVEEPEPAMETERPATAEAPGAPAEPVTDEKPEGPESPEIKEGEA